MTDAVCEVARMKKMRRIRNRSVLALGGVLALGALSVAMADKDPGFPEVGAQYHGFWNYEDEQTASQALYSLRSAGGRSVRVDMGWKTVEPVQGEYAAWALAKYDKSIDLAHSVGLDVLLTIQDSPEWANNGRSKQSSPKDPNDFAKFARSMAERYSGKVSAIEVWNEPNNPDFFVAQQEGREAEEYVKMLRATHEAVEGSRVGNKMAVVAGGSQYVDDRWWDALLRGGACSSTDAITVNPYQLPSDAGPDRPDDGVGSLRHLDVLEAVLDANGCSDKSIWFTEFGWSTHGESPASKPWARGVTEDAQAAYLTTTLRIVKDEYPRVDRVYWYNLRDRGSEASVQNGNYGLLRRDLSEKPALIHLRDILTS